MLRSIVAVCLFFLSIAGTQAQSTEACSGADLTFSFPAPNDSATYSWTWTWPDSTYVLFDGDSVFGSQSTTLTLLNAQPDWAGTSVSCLYDLDADGDVDSTSMSVSITVFGPLDMVSISGNEGPYCLDETATALSLQNPASGGSGNYSYSWVEESSSGGITTVGSGTTYIPSTENSGTSTYTLTVEDNAGCGQVTSNALSVVIWEAITPATIQWDGNSASSVSICDAPVPALEVNTSNPPSGGSDTFSGEWEIDSGAGFATASIWDANAALSVEGIPGSTVSVRAVTSDVCGTVESNIVELYVYTALTTPTISWEDAGQITPLCFGDDPSDVTIAPESPNAGGVTYQWETNQGDGWSDAGPDATGFSTGLLTEDTQIQVTVTSDEGCGSVTSAMFDIPVWPELQGASIASTAPADTTCIDEIPSPLTTLVTSSGADEDFIQQWQVLSANGWSNLNDENGSDLQPGGLDVTTQYRLVSTSTYGCGTVTSNSVTLPVYADITPPTVGPNQTLCYNTAPADLQSSPALGGGGAFSYEWETVTGTVDSLGVSDLIWNPGSLTQTETYRLRADNLNGCGTTYSGNLEIEVLPVFVAGTLLDATIPLDTLCYGTGTTLVATPASGADGGYTISWQVSEAGGSWATISGETGLQLITDNLTESAAFRVFYTSTFGCGTIQANTIDIPVWPDIQASQAELSGGGTSSLLCYGFDAPTAQQSAAATGVNGNFSYQWQTSPNQAGPYTGAENGNTVFYAGALTESLWIRQGATSAVGCGVAFSDPVEISVLPELEAPFIGEDGYQCYGQPAAVIQANSANGADGSFDYLWHFGNALSSMEPDADENGLNLDLGVITSTQYAFVQANSTFGCGTLYSDTIEVFVLDPIQPAVISYTGPSEFCSGLSTGFSSTGFTGGSNMWDFTWQRLVNGEWTDVPNGSSSIYTTPDLYSSETYRLITSDVQGCGDSLSNALNVTVNPRPGPISLSGNLTPCSNSTDNAYSISPWTPDVDYAWSVSAGGEITSGESTLQVLVNWDDNAGLDAQFLQVDQTFMSTGCDTSMVFDVQPTTIAAPDPAAVVKKNGLDVLVCGDSTECATYQWGWMDATTGNIQFIPGATLQYVLLDPFLPESRLYFVDVTYVCEGEDATCPTRSWYTHDPFVGISNPETGFRLGPNPSSGEVTIWPQFEVNHIQVRDQLGRVMLRVPPDSPPPYRLDLSSLPKGAYLIEVQMGRALHRETLLIQ